MAQALSMLHDRDPKLDIFDEVKGLTDLVRPLGAGVLVAVYRRPNVTRSGIYLSDKTKDEDLYQGKVGLVLAMGPIAFAEDMTHRFGDAVPKVGDWVLFAVGETFSFEMGKSRCRIVEDVSVRAVIDQPDIVW